MKKVEGGWLVWISHTGRDVIVDGNIWEAIKYIFKYDYLKRAIIFKKGGQ